MKISIITPTYNDAKSIVETLDSLRMQTCTNWESIIVDDGSTDDTREVISNYIEKYELRDKIKYIYQENSDQLNAIINACQYITGEYVFLLHSDDLLPSNTFFEKCLNIMEEEKSVDALIGDLIIIDENSNEVNCWKAIKYMKKSYLPSLLLLNNGCNIYGDFAFHRRESFLNSIKRNYLIWNTPFWLDISDNPKILNVKNIDFPILKYRIHAENYANNEIGKFNALNGELRTLTRLMSYYDIPLFNIQKSIFQFFRLPGIRKLRLSPHYRPVFRKKETKKKYEIVKQTIVKTYKDESLNVYLEALLGFYKNIGSDREIILSNISNEEIYLGKDIRTFSKKLFRDELSDFYNKIFEEMKIGFTKIRVNNHEDAKLAQNLVKFLNIYPYVKIYVEKE